MIIKPSLTWDWAADGSYGWYFYGAPGAPDSTFGLIDQTAIAGESMIKQVIFPFSGLSKANSNTIDAIALCKSIFLTQFPSKTKAIDGFRATFLWGAGGKTDEEIIFGIAASRNNMLSALDNAYIARIVSNSSTSHIATIYTISKGIISAISAPLTILDPASSPCIAIDFIRYLNTLYIGIAPTNGPDTGQFQASQFNAPSIQFELPHLITIPDFPSHPAMRLNPLAGFGNISSPALADRPLLSGLYEWEGDVEPDILSPTWKAKGQGFYANLTLEFSQYPAAATIFKLLGRAFRIDLKKQSFADTPINVAAIKINNAASDGYCHIYIGEQHFTVAPRTEKVINIRDDAIIEFYGEDISDITLYSDQYTILYGL